MVRDRRGRREHGARRLREGLPARRLRDPPRARQRRGAKKPTTVMPTYEYECAACGKRLEHFQSMSDAPLKKCPKCGKLRLKRLISAGAGVIFKGSGFYTTDYRSSAYNESKKSDSPPRSPSEDRDAKSDYGKPVEADDSGQAPRPRPRRSPRARRSDGGRGDRAPRCPICGAPVSMPSRRRRPAPLAEEVLLSLLLRSLPDGRPRPLAHGPIRDSGRADEGGGGGAAAPAGAEEEE